MIAILAADLLTLGVLVAAVGVRTTGALAVVLCGALMAIGVMYSLFPKEN